MDPEKTETLLRNIRLIFDREIDNLKNYRKFCYILKGKSKGRHSLYSRPSKNFDLSPSDDVVLEWETYKMLTQVYNSVESDKNLRFSFQLELGQQIMRGVHFPSDRIWNFEGGDSASLAFYFLTKIGKLNDIIRALEQRGNGINIGEDEIGYLFRDIALFVHHESNWFDNNSLDRLQKINKEYKSHYDFNRELCDSKITEIKFQRLGKELEGINEEINLHKEIIIDKISKYDFPDELMHFLSELAKIDELPDWKSIHSGMISNMRAFLEELIKNIAKAIKAKTNADFPKNEEKSEMGNLRDYIKERLKLTDKDNKFLNTYVDLLHSEGGHAFLSEKNISN